MTRQLIWRNVRVTALNATFQLLIIYRYRLVTNLRVAHDNHFYGNFINFFLQFKLI